MKTRKASAPVPPYAANPDITVEEEVTLGRKTAKPGDLVKFRKVQGFFVFKYLATNNRTGSQWIDCIDPKTKDYRSFHLERLKEIKLKK